MINETQERIYRARNMAAVFLSGGIGVTPFRSMIKYATDKLLPVKIILFDANRNQDNILYKNEFDECANLNKNLKIIYTISVPDKNRKGELGLIDQTMVTKYLNTIEMDNSVFYICGLVDMLNVNYLGLYPNIWNSRSQNH